MLRGSKVLEKSKNVRQKVGSVQLEYSIYIQIYIEAYVMQ